METRTGKNAPCMTFYVALTRGAVNFVDKEDLLTITCKQLKQTCTI